MYGQIEKLTAEKKPRVGWYVYNISNGQRLCIVMVFISGYNLREVSIFYGALQIDQMKARVRFPGNPKTMPDQN